MPHNMAYIFVNLVQVMAWWCRDDGTRPLPKSVFAYCYHLGCPVAFTWGQFRQDILKMTIAKCVWKLHIKIYSHISLGQLNHWVKGRHMNWLNNACNIRCKTMSRVQVVHLYLVFAGCLLTDKHIHLYMMIQLYRWLSAWLRYLQCIQQWKYCELAPNYPYILNLYL